MAVSSAAPILGADGRPVGAVNLSGPTDRVINNVEAIGQVAKRTATQISEELARRARAIGKGEGRRGS